MMIPIFDSEIPFHAKITVGGYYKLLHILRSHDI